VDEERVAGLVRALAGRGLVEAGPDGRVALTAEGRVEVEKIVRVRREGLHDLLDGWDPDEHPDLRRLLDDLSRSLVSQIPSPA
jgi:Mn-dependent DtxR family transcriptional regulator